MLHTDERRSLNIVAEFRNECSTRRVTDLSPLTQADVLFVRYTVAEGYALADVLTPGTSTKGWMPYRNGWAELKKSVQKGAPSLNPHRNQAGLWALTRVGDRLCQAIESRCARHRR